MRLVSIAMVAALLCCTRASAANELSAQDLMFIQRAAANGRLQMRAAQLALQRADRQVVKNLAQTIVNDYNRINQELAAVAQRNDAVLPADDPAILESQPIMQTKGSEFDKAYAVFVVGVCDVSVALYQAEVATGTNLDTKSWATATLQTVQLHATSAKALQVPPTVPPLVK